MYAVLMLVPTNQLIANAIPKVRACFSQNWHQFVASSTEAESIRLLLDAYWTLRCRKLKGWLAGTTPFSLFNLEMTKDANANVSGTP